MIPRQLISGVAAFSLLSVAATGCGTATGAAVGTGVGAAAGAVYDVVKHNQKD